MMASRLIRPGFLFWVSFLSFTLCFVHSLVLASTIYVSPIFPFFFFSFHGSLRMRRNLVKVRHVMAGTEMMGIGRFPWFPIFHSRSS